MDVSEGRALNFVSDGRTLEGALHLPAKTPAPGIVVCHPHPQYGGDIRNNVVATLCDAAVGAGMAALRFNFRGVGRSEGAFDNGVGEQKDVLAAMAHLRSLPEVDAARIALAGYSFGAAVALRTVAASQMESPPPRALIAVSAPTIAGPLSTPAGDFPLLLVSGDRDEYSEPAELSRLAEAMNPRAEVVIMPGVDHFWWGSDDRLRDTVSGFLAKHVT